MAKTGLDDYLAEGHTLAEVEALTVDRLPTAEREWNMPLPLDDPCGPPFPLEALPETVGAFAAALAEETQTPPDMAATVVLGTISATAGGTYEVVIPEQGWVEPVHGQFVVVAEPGSRKSAVMREATEPIRAYEREMQPGDRRALAEWESQLRVLEKHLATAENAAAKASDKRALADGVAVRMAAAEELETHRERRPRVARIVADDATPQAATSLLAEQGGAIAIMSAESAFLANTAGGRYADAPNLDVLLAGHAGDSITVDRKGRPPERIERACLTLCLMVQPHVIRDLGKAPGFIARGGAARLLASIPRDNLGHRQVDVAPIPGAVSETWSAMITRVVRRLPPRPDGTPVPWQLHLAPDAKTAFRHYRLQHEPQMARDGAYGDIRDWAGKQCGGVLRIAGLLHVAQHHQPESVVIGAETLQQAITIMDYYAEHARVMYHLMRGRSEHGTARIVLETIRALGSSTTRREVHRKLHNRMAFEKAGDLEAPLALLDEYGYIRRKRQTGATGGRPSEEILLNPSERDDRTDTTRIDAVSTTGSVGSVIPFPEHAPASTPGESEPTGKSSAAWEDF